jgi:aryl-alcohol dehydrogenase-like predicted oxidoreductase
MEKRTLGGTGHRSTILALGGAIFIGKPSKKDADTFIKLAMDRGVNHIDVAPTYGDAELGLGKWVKEYRKTLFLACKTRHRTRKEAHEQLNQSLKRLQTDYFDLYQLHGLDKEDELETALGPDGAVQAILDAKKQDLVKHVGITSHNPVNIMKALKRFSFDTVLLPVNCVLRANRQPLNDYEPVLSLAKEKSLGVIAMKSIAKGPWPDDKKPYNTWYQPFHTQKEIDEALCFTLSQDVTTATSSSDIGLATMMLEAAERFEPMSRERQRELVSKYASQKPLFPREPASK